MKPRRDASLPLRERIGWRLLAQARRLKGLPAPILLPVGRAAGRASLVLRRRVMRRSLIHLARAFPDWPKARRLATAWASGSHLGEVWADWLRLSHMPYDHRLRHVDVSALEEPVRKALEAGTGIVIVTGFLGHWEGLAAALAAATGDVLIVTRRSRPRLRHDAVEELRRACAVQGLSFSGARIDAARWLKLNRVVVVVADGDAGRSGVFLPYFGVQASMTDLPVRLAADGASPLLAAFCLKEGPGLWRTRVREIPVPAAAGPEARLAALGAWARLLEEAVRANPGQYVWNHRRWRTRPVHAAALPGGPA